MCVSINFGQNEQHHYPSL